MSDEISDLKSFLQTQQILHPDSNFRIFNGNVQRLYGSQWRLLCEYSKEKRYCKQCGGKELCEHGKLKQYCKECGGSAICEHVKIKTYCKECGGSGICEHRRRKYECKECNLCQNKTVFGLCNQETSPTFKFKYCYPCGVTIFGRNPI